MSQFHFYQTEMGRTFYKETMPELLKQLQEINLNLQHLYLVLVKLFNHLELVEAYKRALRQRPERDPHSAV